LISQNHARDIKETAVILCKSKDFVMNPKIFVLNPKVLGFNPKIPPSNQEVLAIYPQVDTPRHISTLLPCPTALYIQKNHSSVTELRFL
jgi:hypothetical protein